MTNGPRKSECPTVPEKSPNNPGQPAAEGFEGRGLAKANLTEQNASRTPSRSDAPSALERVRQAAGKDMSELVTAFSGFTPPFKQASHSSHRAEMLSLIEQRRINGTRHCFPFLLVCR